MLKFGDFAQISSHDYGAVCCITHMCTVPNVPLGGGKGVRGTGSNVLMDANKHSMKKISDGSRCVELWGEVRTGCHEL